MSRALLTRISAVQDVIAHHEALIARIDDEIESLMRAVRQLQFKKAEQQEHIRQCKGKITLARRLPPEILATIFEQCVLEGWTRTPITVSHVCSEWREAAKAPTVWSHVYVNCDGKDPAARTRFWLSNARDVNLEITLEAHQGVSRHTLMDIMNLLLVHSSRWQTLTIRTLSLIDANYILSLCGEPFPELRHLSASVLEEFDDHDGQNGEETSYHLNHFPKTLQEAPKLRGMHIARNILPTNGVIPSTISELSISLPWMHMNTPLPITSITRILEGLPLLRTLLISIPLGQERTFVPNPEPHTAPNVNVLHLETLTLTGSPGIHGILPHLYAPNLRRLHMRSSTDALGYPHELTGTALVQFLEQASPLLEFLELHDIDIPSEAFERSFTLLPTLQELRLHESEIPDAIINSLNGPMGLCPRLTRLDLRWCGQLSGSSLSALVRSRAANFAARQSRAHFAQPINEITVINCSFVGEKDLFDISEHTICRVIMYDSYDYCRAIGCCQNERYRRRIQLHRVLNPHPTMSYRHRNNGSRLVI